jgi:hypothetical protein
MLMAATIAGLLTLGTMSAPHYHMVPKQPAANLQFRKELLLMAASDPGAAAQIKTLCAEDLLFYVNTFCWTYDPRPDGNRPPVTPFNTYAFQDEAMLNMADCIVSGEDFAIAKSRDMGASWMGLTVFEWFWHFKNDLSFLLISRNEDYVDKRGNPKSLFWKIDFIHEHQPRWLLPEGRSLGWADPHRKLLHLGNADTRSVIDGESTTGDAGRGDRRTAMFIDEHAAFEVNDGFRVLRATRDTTKCRGFNSTPQGANNGFYDVVHNTAARQIRLHWSVHPEKNRGMYTTENGKVKLLDDFRGLVECRSKGEKASRKVRYPEDYPFKIDGKIRSPWYDVQCARCASEMEIAQELDIDFLGSDYQFFDAETIHLLRKKHCRAPELIGDLEFDPETCEPKRFVENDKGKLELWLPLNGEGKPPADRTFAIGCDISAGTGASNSVNSIVDCATGEKIGVWRDSRTLPHPFARLTVSLAKWFNRARIVPDRSGPTGEVAVKEMVARGYSKLYYRRIEKKVGRNLTDEPGMYLNPGARTSLLEDYRDALANHRFINRSDQGMKECLQFIRKGDGSIEHSAAANSQDPSGARAAHGDEVIADGLACLGMTDTSAPRDQEEQEIPENCLAARQQRKANAAALSGQDRLGSGWAS